MNCKELYKDEGVRTDSEILNFLLGKTRGRYEVSASQSSGSYSVINSQAWSGSSSHWPDHSRLADRDEQSM